MKTDWDRLAALRAVFLGETDGRRDDYWHDEALIDAYDRFFGARIRWKWRAVLEDAKRRGFVPPANARIVDWGCGSGVATRAFFDAFPGSAGRVVLFDRSRLAVAFASSKLPGVTVERTTEAPGLADSIVLLSHVANELDGQAIDRLVDALGDARAVLWVEPGTPAASAALVRVRERLRERFHVVAPCTHGNACGMQAAENARHWCHFFAAPDPIVFRSAEWRAFSERLRVDLRSLPTSFFVLDRTLPERLPPAALRLIGRARVYTGYATFLGCGPLAVREEKIRKRDDPERWKRFRDPVFADYVPLPTAES